MRVCMEVGENEWRKRTGARVKIFIGTLVVRVFTCTRVNPGKRDLSGCFNIHTWKAL